MTTKRFPIGFVGGGNMGQALIAALIQKKVFRPNQIAVSEPSADRRRGLRKFGVKIAESNSDLARRSAVILLAVKPQQMRDVLEEIVPVLRRDHLILSIAAGLDTRYFEGQLPFGTRLIRIMPNSPAAIGEGASALFANKFARPADRRFALKIFESAGFAVSVPEEEWLDTVTALSGSGPAFVYEFARALLSAAETQGLPSEVARPLIVKTLIGAGRLLERARDEIPSLIARVASKGGTTEVGLEHLRSRGFGALIAETIQVAVHRARQLRGS